MSQVVAGISIILAFISALLLAVVAFDQLHKAQLVRGSSRTVNLNKVHAYLVAAAENTEQRTKLMTFSGVGAFLLLLVIARSVAVALVMGGMAALVSRILPKYVVQQEQTDRIEKAIAELPNLIDIVALAMSAGVSFDSALELYCSRESSELAKQFERALKSWQLGVSSREEALLALAEEYGFDGMRRFCDTVIESLRFGSPLSEVLEEQSRVMRLEHQAYVQEKIEKAPVKMLVPIGVLILPAMLLAILGPLLASALLATS